MTKLKKGLFLSFLDVHVPFAVYLLNRMMIILFVHFYFSNLPFIRLSAGLNH